MSSRRSLLCRGASKATALYDVPQKDATKVKVLIYNPPHLEVPSHYTLPQNASTDHTASSFNPRQLKVLTDQLSIPELREAVGEAASRHTDSLELAKEVKGLATARKKDFWHVVAGKKFSYSLTNEELEGPLVVTYGEWKILLFRQQGVKRTVNWKGLGTWLWNVVLVFVIFLTLIAIVKCGPESSSWLCAHQSSLQFTALTVIATRIFRKVLGRKSKKNKS